MLAKIRDMSTWLKACDSGACVEVSTDSGVVKIRDSKDPDGPTLTFDLEEWTNFKDGIIRGAFD